MIAAPHLLFLTVLFLAAAWWWKTDRPRPLAVELARAVAAGFAVGGLFWGWT